MTAVYRVLARKYRPTSLGDLVGQQVLVQTLSQAIQNNRLPHAFLLHGIRGVGKTTTARIMARVLNCLNNDTQTGKSIDACGHCTSCQSLTDDRHLDVIEIDAASRTGVDDIREIIESSRYKAVTGRYKIFIIDEVHMLSKSAFNALLKTLEEPPPHVKFIFATTEIRKIPETILSRCMRFDLKRMEPKLLVDYLKKIAQKENFVLEDEAAISLARAADGSMRDGLSLLDQAIALSFVSNQNSETPLPITGQVIYDMLGLADRQRIFTLLRNIFEGQVENTLKRTREFLQEGADPQLLLQDILDIIYGLICIKTSPGFTQNSLWSQGDYNLGTELATPLSASALLSIWQALLKAFEEIKIAPFPDQALEMALLRICYLTDLPPLEDLINSLKGNKGEVSSLSQITTPTIQPRALQQLSATEATAPVPSKSEEKKLKVEPLPATFKDLMALVAKARELVVYSHLLHDVELINYQPGVLTIYLKKETPSAFLPSLKRILETLTQQSWQIHLSINPGQGSTREQQQADYQKTVEQALQHPVVQALQQSFPGSTAQILKQ
jgi:DNA polymerase-3 subunit gamma/tau